MTRSDLKVISKWSNGRYVKYYLFGRGIASGPSFEIDHDYIRDFVDAPIKTALDYLNNEDWISGGRTPDGQLVLTKDGHTVKIGVGFLGGPARFILDGERYDTPDELFDALSI
jgi:hypothetical protein